MASQRGGLIVNTIPMPKLTTMINDFIVKTVNHLNKLSVHVETKLGNFENKMRDIEIMVKLLESKLNSLPPEITSKYPQLVHSTLNDINPEINPVVNVIPEVKKEEPQKEIATENNTNNNIQNNQNSENVIVNQNNPTTNPTVEEVVAKEVVEETPEQKLQNFLTENESDDLDRLYKSLKMRVQEAAIYQKARMMGFDEEKLNVKYIFIFLDFNRII